VQVLDVLDVLFVSMFDGLSKDNAGLVETVFSQYPQEPFEYLPKSLRLTFAEGIAMLKEAGIDADPLGDLNTELERKLGKLVKVLTCPPPSLSPCGGRVHQCRHSIHRLWLGRSLVCVDRAPKFACVTLQTRVGVWTRGELGAPWP